MFSLIYSCTKKYLASAELKIGLAAALAAGIICGILFRPGSDSAMIVATAPVIISVAVAVMNITKEWEYRTFANKLIVGHTKVKIFFSELLVALAAGMAVYALFGIGFAAASPKTVFVPKWPAIFKISALMTLAGLSLCAMAAVISFACKSHNPAMILSFAAIFAMFLTSQQIYEFVFSNEIRSEIYENYYSSLSPDPVTGEYVDPLTGTRVEAEDYVPTRVIKLAKAAYALNPIGAFDLYANELFPYLEGSRPDEWSRYPRSLPLCSLSLTAALTVLGALTFRNKDVK